MTQPAPSIIDAINHPQLFAPFFRGTSWDVWKVFLRGLFGLPLSDDDMQVFTACTGRSIAPSQLFREACLVVGRRGGKSRVLATVATYLATFRDYTSYLAPGETATVAVIAASRQQARSIYGYIGGLIHAVPALEAMLQDEGSEILTLNNRCRIEIHTASFRVTRGYTFAAILADETAFWRDENSANPDTEIFRALRPGLATIPGSVLLNASSPYRKAGVLYNTFRRFHGRDDAKVLVWQAPSLVMNPALDPDIVEEARQEDPEAAAAEYDAEFRNDLADFVSRDLVAAVTIPDRLELLPASDIHYYGFIDPSG